MKKENSDFCSGETSCKISSRRVSPSFNYSLKLRFLYKNKKTYKTIAETRNCKIFDFLYNCLKPSKIEDAKLKVKSCHSLFQ